MTVKRKCWLDGHVTGQHRWPGCRATPANRKPVSRSTTPPCLQGRQLRYRGTAVRGRDRRDQVGFLGSGSPGSAESQPGVPASWPAPPTGRRRDRHRRGPRSPRARRGSRRRPPRGPPRRRRAGPAVEVAPGNRSGIRTIARASRRRRSGRGSGRTRRRPHPGYADAGRRVPPPVEPDQRDGIGAQPSPMVRHGSQVWTCAVSASASAGEIEVEAAAVSHGRVRG